MFDWMDLFFLDFAVVELFHREYDRFLLSTIDDFHWSNRLNIAYYPRRSFEDDFARWIEDILTWHHAIMSTKLNERLIMRKKRDRRRYARFKRWLTLKTDKQTCWHDIDLLFLLNLQNLELNSISNSNVSLQRICMICWLYKAMELFSILNFIALFFGWIRWIIRWITCCIINTFL